MVVLAHSMESFTLMKALSLGMNIRAGYDRLNAGNLEPRINAAADKTAESFDELTSDHLYVAIKSERLDEFTEGFRSYEEESAIERFASILDDEVVHPSIEIDFESASQEFFTNLDREIAEKDPILWRQLQSYKLDVITEITQQIRNKQEGDTDNRSTDSITGIVEPLDSVYSHFTSEVDEKLVEPVRELDKVNRRRAEEVFEAIVKQNIYEKTGVEFKKFQRELESEHLIFIDPESITEDLSIDIANGFDQLEFIVPPGSTNDRMTIENPGLLWDCSCGFSEGRNCRIHSNEIGNEVSRRFRRDYVKISYRNMSVIWKDSQFFWPPSVDTIYMIENLLEEDIHKERAESICEIGCGTSLMGIVLSHMNENVNQLYASDWLLTPIVFSRINWEMNKEKIGRCSLTPILGYGSYWVEHPPPRDIKIDQAYCNPPYLPNMAGFNSMTDQDTVGGTALLELLIEEGGEFADSLFVNFSEIALPEAKESESKSQATLEQIGSTHTVPFRVPSALASRDYMNYLINNRNLKVRNNSRYRFWHDITTYQLKFG